MRRAYGRHLDDLSFNQLQALVRPEQAGNAHGLVLLHREEVLCRFDGHAYQSTAPPMPSENSSASASIVRIGSSRTTFTLDEKLIEHARQLGVNISAAARQGVADAVRAALARADREAYLRQPERPDTFWNEAEAWGEP